MNSILLQQPLQFRVRKKVRAFEIYTCFNFLNYTYTDVIKFVKKVLSMELIHPRRVFI